MYEREVRLVEEGVERGEDDSYKEGMKGQTRCSPFAGYYADTARR